MEIVLQLYFSGGDRFFNRESHLGCPIDNKSSLHPFFSQWCSSEHQTNVICEFLAHPTQFGQIETLGNIKTHTIIATRHMQLFKFSNQGRRQKHVRISWLGKIIP